jgi:hypothetical protein
MRIAPSSAGTSQRSVKGNVRQQTAIPVNSIATVINPIATGVYSPSCN